MLSAVESFGPASGATSHPYAHHSHFAIAAAAAAGSAAAAAAAAVIPQHNNSNNICSSSHSHNIHQYSLQQQHQHLHQQQLLQQQQQQIHHHLHSTRTDSALQFEPHLSAASIFLSRPPSSIPFISSPSLSPSTNNNNSNINNNKNNNSKNSTLHPSALVFATKCSSQKLQHPQQSQRSTRSPRRTLSQLEVDEGNAMASAEFAKPHPKQPRYSGVNNSANTLNNSNNNSTHTNSNINNSNNNHINSNANITCNAIPLHQRSPTGASTNTTIKASSVSLKNGLTAGSATSHLRLKYSNEQSGPVNLVTSHTNNHSRITRTPPDLAGSRSNSSSSSSVDVESDGSIDDMSTVEGSQSKKVTGNAMSESVMVFNGGVSSQKLPYPSQSVNAAAAQNNAVAAAAVAAAYQYNYPHLYTSRALYGTSPLFPGHHPLSSHSTLRPCPTYLGGPPLPPQQQHQHQPFPNYLQAAAAVAAAASGVYSSTQASQQSQASQVLLTPSGSMIGIGTQPQQHSTASLLSNGHGHSHHQSQLAMSAGSDLRQKNCNERLAPPPPPPAKDISQVNGTYLNGKVNTSPADPESISGFKVPSGKEGSLKHRILTRPSQSSLTCLSTASSSFPDHNKTETRSSITASVVRSNSCTTSNFTKGAYIELSNGVLRRVEDMRTEDFIQSAERSLHHQLAESTVVKINAAPNGGVAITFSYDKNRPKADVEVTQDHPFFVYGQGWASCNPELTLKAFGLKCQRLQVGDICISLILRESATALICSGSGSSNIKMHQAQSHTSPSNGSSVQSYLQGAQFDKSDLSLTLPQNLSRKVHHQGQPHRQQQQQQQLHYLESTGTNSFASSGTISNITSTSTAGNCVTSHLTVGATASTYPMHNIPLHLMPSHLQHHPPQQHAYADMTKIVAAYESASNVQISRSNPNSTHLPPHNHHLSQNTITSFYHHQQQQQHHHHQHHHQEHPFHSLTSKSISTDFQSSLAAAVAVAAASAAQQPATSPRFPPQSLSEPIPIHATRPPSIHNQSYYESPPSSTEGDSRRNHSNDLCSDNDNDQPVDASMSRKRRWSAPENICDAEDDVQLHAQPPQPASYKTFITNPSS